MKRVCLIGALGAVTFSFTALPSHATLFDRGAGLLYDDVLDVTWLQDANYAMTSGADADGKLAWDEAIAWVAGLSYNGYDDWRLARALPVNGVAYDLTNNPDGSTDNGYNITSPNSELSYMYHVNLNGVSLVSPAGVFQPGISGIADPSPFIGISGGVWTENELPDDAVNVFLVGMGNGHQNWFAKDTEHFSWAVRDGDVAVTLSGDITRDGVVNVADLLVAARMLFEGTPVMGADLFILDNAPLVRGVANPDFEFTLGDLWVLCQEVFGLISIN